MIAIMCILVLIMVSYQYWLRKVYFARYPEVEKLALLMENDLRSPADGTVVYVNLNTTVDDLIISKRENSDRRFLVKDLLMPSMMYNHIGIFMSQYDNHHVLNPLRAELLTAQMRGEENPAEMLPFIDNLLNTVGIKYTNWSEKAESFITRNQQFVMEFDNGVVIVITMDKFVNKLTMYSSKVDFNLMSVRGLRKVLGFIHRGSQTDIFIPTDLTNEILVSPGQKVDYSTNLVRLK